MLSSILRQILKFFFQGLIILGPFAVTVYCVIFVIENMDDLIPESLKYFPGIGIILVFLFIGIIGYLGERFFLTKWLIHIFDSIIEKIPGIKFIYTSTKDVISSFVGDKKKFNHPVWVRVRETPEMWRIGFLTQGKLTYKSMEDKVAVYLPHSYAISGWVIITKAEHIIPITDMNASEAMKFAVSGGVTGHDPKGSEDYDK